MDVGFPTNGKKMELAEKTLNSIKELKETINRNSIISSKQNKWMIILTVAIAILTIVMIIQAFCS